MQRSTLSRWLRSSLISFDLLVAITLVVLACHPEPAFCEIYRDFTPYKSLGDIRKSYPNAQLHHIYPAWATDATPTFLMSGTGISGKIFLVFRDLRPGYRELASSAESEELKASFLEKAKASESESLELLWLRWIPDYPIPLERVVSKYGRHDEIAYSDEDFTPIANWPKRALSALLNDKKDQVLSITFTFTTQESGQAVIDAIIKAP